MPESLDEVTTLRGELRAATEALTSALTELRVSARERSEQVAVLERERCELAERVRMLQQTVDAKNRAIAEREHSLDCLLRSPSWRLTAPLRTLKALVSRGRS